MARATICRRSCASAAGSAATATATRSSPTTCCARRCALQSARALRLLSRRAAPARRRTVARQPAGRRLATRSRELAARSPDRSPTAATSPIGAPSPASTRGWPRRRAALDQLEPPHMPSATRRPIATAANCSPISRSSTTRWSPTARRCWPRAGCATCAAPSMCSAFISPRSICARTPTCTSASSPSCSRLAQPGTDYAALAEDRAHRAAARRAGDGAAARLAVLCLFGRDRERAGDRARDRRGASPLRAGFGAALRDLQGDRRFRHPRSRRAAQGSRAAAAARGRARPRHRAAVRDHRRSAQLRRA